MTVPKLPEDVGSTEPIFPTKPVALGEGTGEGGGQSFATLMATSPTPMQASGKSSLISPFELVGGTPIAQPPVAESLLSQLQQAKGTASDIYAQLNALNNPNLASKLKLYQKNLLKEKLRGANQKLQKAHALLGGQLPEPVDPSQFKGPLGKFFAYLTNGQKLMESAQAKLRTMGQSGHPLNAGEFLNLQAMIGSAQQQLEFSSLLLSNTVQAFKQLMQLQI